eukprot:CAMPEP_0119526394 /NCGR_PEP_ID=MMETSP1344-20130328/41011_1 /TAXON_ID=236787 /ORGANISM="Florenciella parvula, Strain CCMP2471" /LENGTH=674 /DNA_ID=CAMNT_0007565369 /DNA_START=175 /DNA_END=2199 /DNA_ORIENTATION=+
MPWDIPLDGSLQIEFKAEPQPPSIEEMGSDNGVKGLVHNMEHASTDGEKVSVFRMATVESEVYFSTEQAQSVTTAMHGLLGSLETVGALLPCMAEVEGRAQIVATNMSLKEQFQLRVKLGNAWKPLMGNATGFYSLDFTRQTDRRAATSLAQVANSERNDGKNNGIRSDTSQKGNWLSYRNESYNKAPLPQPLEPSFFNTLPMFGHMNFDYVSTHRPPKGSKALSDARFDKLLETIRKERDNIDLDTGFHVSTLLKGSRPGTSVECGGGERGGTSGADLATILGVVDNQQQIAGMSSRDSRELDERPASPAPARPHSPTSSVGSSRPESPVAHGPGFGPLGFGFEQEQGPTSTKFDPIAAESVDSQNARRGLFVDELIKYNDIVTAWKGFTETTLAVRQAKELAALEKAAAELEQRKNARKGNPTGAKDEHKGGHKKGKKHAKHPSGDAISKNGTMGEDGGSILHQEEPALLPEPTEPSLEFVRGYVTLLKLEALLCCKYVSTEQAGVLLRLFPRDDGLWVMVLTTLFSRLLDLGEVDGLLNIMTQQERNEASHRLGWLNLFNPMYPERDYQLELNHWDQRETCKIIVELAMAEEGENWVDEAYRRRRDMPWVPGWQFPEGFNKPDFDENGKEQGVYREGDLLARYVSPKVEMDARKALQFRTLSGATQIYGHH